MIVDSSALLAIILEEIDEPAFLRAIAGTANANMSAASYLEVALKLDEADVNMVLDDTIERLRITLVPVTVEQGKLARHAAIRFGRRTRARLNFGDCMTYALAKSTGEPLLFKGDDFTHTDLPRISVGG